MFSIKQFIEIDNKSRKLHKIKAYWEAQAFLYWCFQQSPETLLKAAYND